MGEFPTDMSETGREQPDGSTHDYDELVRQYFDFQTTDVATVEDLTAYIRDRHSSDVDETRLQIRLHHLILPRLGDAGLIEYDARSNTARYRDEREHEQAHAPRWVHDDD